MDSVVISPDDGALPLRHRAPRADAEENRPYLSTGTPLQRGPVVLLHTGLQIRGVLPAKHQSGRLGGEGVGQLSDSQNGVNTGVAAQPRPYWEGRAATGRISSGGSNRSGHMPGAADRLSAEAAQATRWAKPSTGIGLSPAAPPRAETEAGTLSRTSSRSDAGALTSPDAATGQKTRLTRPASGSMSTTRTLLADYGTHVIEPMVETDVVAMRVSHRRRRHSRTRRRRSQRGSLGPAGSSTSRASTPSLTQPLEVGPSPHPVVAVSVGKDGGAQQGRRARHASHMRPDLGDDMSYERATETEVTAVSVAYPRRRRRGDSRRRSRGRAPDTHVETHGGDGHAAREPPPEKPVVVYPVEEEEAPTLPTSDAGAGEREADAACHSDPPSPRTSTNTPSVGEIGSERWSTAAVNGLEAEEVQRPALERGDDSEVVLRALQADLQRMAHRPPPAHPTERSPHHPYNNKGSGGGAGGSTSSTTTRPPLTPRASFRAAESAARADTLHSPGRGRKLVLGLSPLAGSRGEGQGLQSPILSDSTPTTTKTTTTTTTLIGHEDREGGSTSVDGDNPGEVGEPHSVGIFGPATIALSRLSVSSSESVPYLAVPGAMARQDEVEEEGGVTSDGGNADIASASLCSASGRSLTAAQVLRAAAAEVALAAQSMTTESELAGSRTAVEHVRCTVTVRELTSPASWSHVHALVADGMSEASAHSSFSELRVVSVVASERGGDVAPPPRKVSPLRSEATMRPVTHVRATTVELCSVSSGTPLSTHTPATAVRGERPRTPRACDGVAPAPVHLARPASVAMSNSSSSRWGTAEAPAHVADGYASSVTDTPLPSCVVGGSLELGSGTAGHRRHSLEVRPGTVAMLTSASGYSSFSGRVPPLSASTVAAASYVCVEASERVLARSTRSEEVEAREVCTREEAESSLASPRSEVFSDALSAVDVGAPLPDQMATPAALHLHRIASRRLSNVSEDSAKALRTSAVRGSPMAGSVGHRIPVSVGVQVPSPVDVVLAEGVAEGTAAVPPPPFEVVKVTATTLNSPTLAKEQGERRRRWVFSSAVMDIKPRQLGSEPAPALKDHQRSACNALPPPPRSSSPADRDRLSASTGVKKEQIARDLPEDTMAAPHRPSTPPQPAAAPRAKRRSTLCLRIIERSERRPSAAPAQAMEPVPSSSPPAGSTTPPEPSVAPTRAEATASTAPPTATSRPAAARRWRAPGATAQPRRAAPAGSKSALPAAATYPPESERTRFRNFRDYLASQPSRTVSPHSGAPLLAPREWLRQRRARYPTQTQTAHASASGVASHVSAEAPAARQAVVSGSGWSERPSYANQAEMNGYVVEPDSPRPGQGGPFLRSAYASSTRVRSAGTPDPREPCEEVFAHNHIPRQRSAAGSTNASHVSRIFTPCATGRVHSVILMEAVPAGSSAGLQTIHGRPGAAPTGEAHHSAFAAAAAAAREVSR